MNLAALTTAATKSLPLMTGPKREEAQRLIAELQLANVSFQPEAGKTAAASAFESDMQPLCKAVAAALHAGDLEALRGLRALLPHLLEEINRDPALANELASQMGRAVLTGLNAGPEETL